MHEVVINKKEPNGLHEFMSTMREDVSSDCLAKGCLVEVVQGIGYLK